MAGKSEGKKEIKVGQRIDDIPWKPHPHRPTISIKSLITAEEHNLGVTCMMVSVPVGKEVPEHIHEGQAEILFPVQGRGVMRVEGMGDFDVAPGMIFSVPKGIRHKIDNVSEDLLLYGVFVPALF